MVVLHRNDDNPGVNTDTFAACYHHFDARAFVMGSVLAHAHAVLALSSSPEEDYPSIWMSHVVYVYIYIYISHITYHFCRTGDKVDQHQQ